MPGRAQPEAVLYDAGLLADWMLERREKRTRNSRLSVGLFGAIAALAVLLAIVPATIITNLMRSSSAERELKALLAQDNDLQKMDKEIQALQTQAALVSGSHGGKVRVLNRILAVANAKDADIAVNSIALQIQGEKLEVSGEAEAVSFLSANRFLKAIEESAPGVQAVMANARQSTVLGEMGISFTFLTSGRAKK